MKNLNKKNYDTDRMVAEYGFSMPELSNKSCENYLSQDKEVYLICDYCKKSFSLEVEVLKRRLARDFPDLVCQGEECRKFQRKKVIQKMHEINRKNGHFIKIGNKKRGKTYEEMFGEERAKEYKAIIREKRLSQECPRTGKLHSEDSKKQMSIKRLAFFARNEKKYKSPVSGKLLGFKEYFSEVLKLKYANMPQEEKVKRRLEATKRLLKFERKSNGCVIKEVRYWYDNTKHALSESSYELLYFLYLNEKKIFWKRNDEITIKYNHPKNGESFFIPDILIFSDKNLKKLKEIIEVKPIDFLENPHKSETLPYTITEAKIKGLIDYCAENKLNWDAITELDLDDDMIKLGIELYPEETENFLYIAQRRERNFRRIENGF